MLRAMAAVAYLRRSRVDTRKPGALSHAQQLAAIKSEAAKHGDDDPIVIEDWGRSGRDEKLHLRDGFATLEKMVEAGDVSAVYAFDLSRLGRSLVTVYRLAKRCADLGIPVRCATGYSPDVSSAEGRMVLGILLSIGQYFAESTQERMTSLARMRKDNGEYLGKAPFGFRVEDGKLVPDEDEDVAVLLDAYRRAGSFQGAARLLTNEGVKSRKGNAWQASVVRLLLRRHAADELPRRAPRGRPPEQSFRLRGLLRCHCGATLSGRHGKARRTETISYECKRGWMPGHARPYSVSERVLLPLIQAEAGKLRTPGTVIRRGDDLDSAERRANLVEARRRVAEDYFDPSTLLSKEERDRRLADIDAELDEIDEAERAAMTSLLPIPAIEWDGPIDELNTVLRALWTDIKLGPDLMPAEYHRAVPDWWA